MNIVVDFYMPPHLFDSARADNGNESVTERIAKVILESVLGYRDVRRGDPQVHEPDYVCGEKGFEVTLAESQKLIPQLRGSRSADGVQHELEDVIAEDLISEKIKTDQIVKVGAHQGKLKFTILDELVI